MSTLAKEALEALRFPIGRFDPKLTIGAAERSGLIDSIAATPARLRAAIMNLTAEQLDSPYRDGGWTVRQLVHHVPDSHLNAYIRFKWTLTEDVPTIKTYDQTRWAQLPDSSDTPIEISLTMLDALHNRWVGLLRAMTDTDFARQFHHPEWGKIDLNVMTRLYEWHGRHHVAHITRLKERMGW